MFTCSVFLAAGQAAFKWNQAWHSSEVIGAYREKDTCKSREVKRLKECTPALSLFLAVVSINMLLCGYIYLDDFHWNRILTCYLDLDFFCWRSYSNLYLLLRLSLFLMDLISTDIIHSVDFDLNDFHWNLTVICDLDHDFAIQCHIEHEVKRCVLF